jgi:hypothetical protein
MRRRGRFEGARWLGGRRGARLALVSVSTLLVLPFGALGGTAIGAAVSNAAAATTCAGTQASPATLAGGTYSSVTVTGVCGVNGGQVVVTGNVTVEGPNGALVATFARNAHGAGTSGITVHGSILVNNGATLFLGCFASSSPCNDDPNKNTNPTLNSPDVVNGDVIATNALALIVHDSAIVGDVRDSGGGGGAFTGPGKNCTPTGIFNKFGSPVFSDFEDSIIGGNVSVVGLQTCWLGALRDKVGGSVSFLNNTMADPDASEILTSTIQGNLICAGNLPANQFGDSHGSPDTVGGFANGQCSFGVLQRNPSIPTGTLEHLSVPSKALPGYDLGAGDGGVFSFGARFFGSAAGIASATPYVGIAAAPGGDGYWLANANGLVSNFGPNGRSFGSAASFPLTKPVVGIAAAPGGDGYWEAAGDGGVFSFGPSAPFFGSAGSIHLNQPIVGVAAAPGGDGYDLVATDGGVFTYGPGAHFHGSTGSIHLNQPVVGMVVDPATGGYWLVAADGGVFSFNAPFYGSLGAIHLNQPIVGIVAAPTGNGYDLVASDGGVFAFGPGAHFQGSLGNVHLNAPIDGIALG